jgi:hypothetical protein
MPLYTNKGYLSFSSETTKAFNISNIALGLATSANTLATSITSFSLTVNSAVASISSSVNTANTILTSALRTSNTRFTLFDNYSPDKTGATDISAKLQAAFRDSANSNTVVYISNGK